MAKTATNSVRQVTLCQPFKKAKGLANAQRSGHAKTAKIFHQSEAETVSVVSVLVEAFGDTASPRQAISPIKTIKVSRVEIRIPAAINVVMAGDVSDLGGAATALTTKARVRGIHGRVITAGAETETLAVKPESGEVSRFT